MLSCVEAVRRRLPAEGVAAFLAELKPLLRRLKRRRLRRTPQMQKRQNQLKKTCYANSSQQKLIRKKMRDIMSAQASSCELQELVNKFIPEVIGKEIEKACHGVYPLQNVHIRKVKMLKKPKFDLTKLLDIHGDSGLAPVGGDKGEEVQVADLGEGAEQKEVVGA